MWKSTAKIQGKAFDSVVWLVTLVVIEEKEPHDAWPLGIDANSIGSVDHDGGKDVGVSGFLSI